MLTLQELKDRIAYRKDPDDLVEMLDISSQQLVDRFEDAIEERFTGLCEEFEDVEEEESNS